jgi:hypothetical protein
MKKLRLIVSILFLCLSVVVYSQEHKDYFVGKWSVVAAGTPNGDSKMIIDLKRINGKLQGLILREGKDPKEISKVEETPNTVRVYFKHLFYNVKIQLSTKDENHTVGSLMDKYKTTGVRLK